MVVSSLITRQADGTFFVREVIRNFGANFCIDDFCIYDKIDGTDLKKKRNLLSAGESAWCVAVVNLHIPLQCEMKGCTITDVIPTRDTHCELYSYTIDGKFLLYTLN